VGIRDELAGKFLPSGIKLVVVRYGSPYHVNNIVFLTYLIG